MATKRKYLCGRRSRGKILIDMEKVYKMIDSGIKMTDVADKLGVSPSTLRRRHQEYQREIELMEHEMDLADLGLPPLPDAEVPEKM